MMRAALAIMPLVPKVNAVGARISAASAVLAA